MTKNTYIVAAMLCSILSYGQQITFHKNVNYKANSLQQSLNKGGDSLILVSEDKQIFKVDIYNKSFSESIDVYSNKTKIDLKTLPVGNFVIQAKLGENWIIMYLEKNEEAKIAASDKNVQVIDYESIESKGKSYKITASNKNNQDIDYKGLASDHKSDKTVKKNSSLYYWVVSESNSSFGSSKSMRLEYKEDIAKLILKNKLELKSNVGKNNKLIIYEIYNTSKFMPKQLRNPIYYKTEQSNFFNVVPIYATNE